MTSHTQTPTASALPVLQTLAEECWYMFLRYNHGHFDRRYVMRLVIHYQFVKGSARELCRLLAAGDGQNTDAANDTSLQQRLNFYKKLAQHNQQELCHLPYNQALMRVTNDLVGSSTHNHEALVRELQETSREEFVPGTPTEELIHKVMLEGVLED